MSSSNVKFCRIGAAVSALLLSAPALAQQAAPTLDRTALPIPQPAPPQYTELDVRDATPPPRFVVNAPEGAPNVLLVLVDGQERGVASFSKFWWCSTRVEKLTRHQDACVTGQPKSAVRRGQL